MYSNFVESNLSFANVYFECRVIVVYVTGLLPTSSFGRTHPGLKLPAHRDYC